MLDNFTIPNDEIDLFELIETLRSEKILIARITFVAGILGAIYTFIAHPTFEAQHGNYRKSAISSIQSRGV